MKISKGVLIIDDDPNIREICQSYLTENFSNIFLADNAMAGLELLKRENIEIVLIDLHMPRMNGFDFVEIAKKKYPNVRYIFISGSVTIMNLHRSVRSGVFDFIEKPFSQTTLLERITYACKDDIHIYSNQSLKSVISEITRDNNVQKKKLLLELRDEIMSKIDLCNGNIEVLRFDIEDLFELHLQSEQGQLINGLTPVESKVAEMLEAGMSAMAISRKLNRSINTVQVHIRSIRKKLGLVKHARTYDQKEIV